MFDLETSSKRARSLLSASLPDWAILADTGMMDAPSVAIWRTGNTVYLATPCECDASECMAQVADSSAECGKAKRTDLAVHAVRFPTDDQAARYMRDVRRIHRANGQSDKRRTESAPIPV